MTGLGVPYSELESDVENLALADCQKPAKFDRYPLAQPPARPARSAHSDQIDPLQAKSGHRGQKAPKFDFDSRTAAALLSVRR